MTTSKDPSTEPEFTIDGEEIGDINENRPAPPPTMSQLQQEAFDTDSGLSPEASGHWTHAWFSVFDTIFTSLFWTAFCCTPCVYGQLMQRIGVSWFLGQPIGTSSSPTCLLLAILCAFAWWSFWWGWSWNWTRVVLIAILAYCAFLYMMTRGEMRRRYGIAAEYFPALDGRVEDGVCAVFCSCCSGIQMIRQTHDEGRYPYNACSQTGLASYAPQMLPGSQQAHAQQSPAAMEMTQQQQPPSPHSTQIKTDVDGDNDIDMSNVDII